MNSELLGRMQVSRLVFAGLALALPLLLGCERREKVFELDSPAVDVEVEKSDGGVEVDVKKDGESEEERP